jgi:hypothetical protein
VLYFFQIVFQILVFLINCLYQITAYNILLIFRFNTFVAFFYMFKHLFIFILNLLCGFLHISYLSFPILVLLIKNSFFMELLGHELVFKSSNFVFVIHMTLYYCGFIWIIAAFMLQGLRAWPFQIGLRSLSNFHWRT